MRIRSTVLVITLAFGFMPNIAQANVRPIVESFTFTPNDFDLISASTNVSFELVVSHPSGISNTSTLVTLTGPYKSILGTNLIRIDSPVNLALTKVTFKGILTVPQNVIPGAYSVSVVGVENNSSAGYRYGTGAITPDKLRDLIGAESALLVRKNGDLNLVYDTFVGPTHDTRVGIAYNNPAVYNNNNPPIWRVGETYTPSKYYEARIPTLPLVVTTTAPTVCSTDGNELKLISVGNCTFMVSTTKTKNYAAKESSQSVTIVEGRSTPQLTMGTISNQTSKNLPKTIEIFRVYGPTGVLVLPQSTTPTVCFGAGFYVQIVGGGTCTLTYQSEPISSYFASALYKISFEVTRDPQTITFNSATSVNLIDKSLTLTTTASSGGMVIFSTTTGEICSVTGSTVNFLKAGSCLVTATQPGTASFSPISATATINIVGAPILVKNTITCVKGKATKKVKGINPKCPKGYKVKT